MTAATPLILVVDDDASVRRALERLFKSAGWEAKAFASADEFLSWPCPDQPACLVLDVRMPGVSGLELQQRLADSRRELPIVFLTAHGDVPMTVQAMQRGAVNFLLKPFENPQLLEAVREALDRSARHRERRHEVEKARELYESLTAREREVMALVAAGLPNKSVARQLGIAEKTVKVHRGQVMDKMQAGSLADLVRLAQKLGLSPRSPSVPL